MIYYFGSCTLDTERHILINGETSVHVEPQVFALLQMMAERAGQLVSKDDMIETVWAGLNISDSTISARINAARKAVGDTGRDQRIIKTVHKRGFQMIAPVSHDPTPTPNPNFDHQTVRLTASSDGATIAYAKSGSGPPLVRVAHWLSHLELDWRSPIWQPLIQNLGQAHTLYRYDQRGTGLSAGGLDQVDLNAFVDDLTAVADSCGLTKFPIFAASQAVPVAIRYAQRFPDRVSGLILYGGYAQGRMIRAAAPNDVEETTMLDLIRAGWGKASSPFMQAFSSLFIPDATPDQIDSLIQMQMETIAPNDAACLRQIIDRFDVTDALAGVRAPTLVIHARADAIQPIAQSRMIAAMIPAAEFITLDSRNHIPLPQEPSWDILTTEVARFLTSLD